MDLIIYGYRYMYRYAQVLDDVEQLRGYNLRYICPGGVERESIVLPMAPCEVREALPCTV